MLTRVVGQKMGRGGEGQLVIGQGRGVATWITLPYGVKLIHSDTSLHSDCSTYSSVHRGGFDKN